MSILEYPLSLYLISQEPHLAPLTAQCALRNAQYVRMSAIAVGLRARTGERHGFKSEPGRGSIYRGGERVRSEYVQVDIFLGWSGVYSCLSFGVEQKIFGYGGYFLGLYRKNVKIAYFLGLY